MSPLALLGSGYEGAGGPLPGLLKRFLSALRPGTGSPLGALSLDPAGLPAPLTLGGVHGQGSGGPLALRAVLDVAPWEQRGGPKIPRLGGQATGVGAHLRVCGHPRPRVEPGQNQTSRRAEPEATLCSQRPPAPAEGLEPGPAALPAGT